MNRKRLHPLTSRSPLSNSHFTLSSGFSLLELIAAMTILVIVIGILGRIVTDTQRVWRHGADRAQLTASVRATFAILEEDLSAAIANSNLVFELELLDPDRTLHGTNVATSLLFYRMRSVTPGHKERALQQIHLIATDANSMGLKALFRERRPVLFDEEYPGDWFEWAETNRASQLFLDNIVSLKIRPGHPTNSTYQADQAYYSEDNDHRLPAWLDLEVALLPERQARRISFLSNPELHSETHATVFQHRFYLQNREGGRLP